MKSKFKMVAMAACAVVGGGLSADVVHEVAGGQSQNIPLINTSERVIFKGGGTFVLQDGNTFGGGVVVSNGVLSADYQASGLAATHLSLVGTGNGNTSLAILRPKGATFTADVASSGAGTVSFERCAGLSPNDQTLTVNLGGDGRVLKHKTDGFMTSEFILGFSNQHDLIFKNGIDLNGNDFTLKNPGSNKPAYFDGVIKNSGASGKAFTYWDGTTIFRGQSGQVHFDNKVNWRPQNGTLVYSNCTVRIAQELWAGHQNAVLNLRFIGGTDYKSTAGGGTVYCGNSGSTLTVDNSTFDYDGNFHFGDDVNYVSPSQQEGNLVVTNNATVKMKNLNLRRGAVDQYSGLVTVSNGADIAVTLGSFSGQSVYTLYGGTIAMKKGKWWKVNTENSAWAVLNQKGGTINIWEALEIGGNTGLGAANIHGGIFENVRTGDDKGVVVGAGGNGRLSIANGGIVRVPYAGLGVKMGDNAASSGVLSLDPLGELEVAKIYSGSGKGEVIFNGGTFRPNASAAAADPIVTSEPIAVTELGGVFDTNGKGDFTLPRALVAGTHSLAHRWTFASGSLVDEIGGVTAEVGSGVTVSEGKMLLPGGSADTGRVKLGKGLIGQKVNGWSCEAVFTLKSLVWNTPFIQCNMDRNNSFSVNLNKWIDRGWGVIAGAHERRGNYTLEVNVPYRLSFSIEPSDGGRWKIVASLHNAETGEFYEEVSETTYNHWQLSSFNSDSEIWIGKNAWGDVAPNVEISEIKMYDRSFTSVERNWRAAVAAGGVRYFTKKGEGMLTLTGVNTYKAGTAVEGGTLKLAAGATLPATPIKACAGAVLDLTNQGTTQEASRLEGAGTIRGGAIAVTDAIKPGDATGVGTLTVDGTDITASKFVATIGEDGTTCGLLSGAGTLDASGLTVELANPEALVRGTVYHLVNGLAVSGKAAAGESIPKRWSVVTSQTGIKLVNAGFAIILK